MDWTPLPFSFTNGGTYADTGDKVRGGASGLEKRQCAAQITLFADGEPRVKPLLIFKGKGKRISFREKVSRALSMLVLIIVLWKQAREEKYIILEKIPGSSRDLYFSSLACFHICLYQGHW